MKKIVIALSLLVTGTALAATPYTATGLVNQVKIISGATASTAKLKVTFRSETGTKKSMCKNGTTNIYEASVPADKNASIVLVQSMLTAAMMAQHSVDVVSIWNGTYCEIQTVTYED